MNSFLAVIQRELNQIKQSKLLIFIIFVLPLFFCYISCETFCKGYAFNLPIAVIDNDNSALSRQMVRMVNSTPSVNVAFRVLSLKEGEDLINRSKAYAILYIPSNFEKDIYSLKRSQPVLYYNNQYMLIGSMVSKDILTAVTTFSTGVGIKLRMKTEKIGQSQAMARSIPVALRDSIRSNPFMNYSYSVATAVFIQIFHILVCFVSIWAFGIEYKRGSAKEWFQTAGNSTFIAVVGKLLPYFIFVFTMLLLCYVIIFVIYAVPLKGNIAFLLFSTAVFILAYQLMGLFFVELLRNMRFAMSCCAVYTSLGFTFAGVTFPVLAMPLVGRLYSLLIPLQPYMRIFYNQTLRNVPYQYDLKNLCMMLIMFLPAIVCAYRLKQGAENEKYWGLE